MKIAIVGAGVSGLTAARALIDRGIDVTVFEKSRGVGGRLATKRLEWGSIDIGAQYFTARDPRFQYQVSQWQKDGIVDYWSFTPHTLTKTGLILSPDETQRYVGVPKMNSITHALASGIDIIFNVRVEHITHGSDGWTMTISDQGERPERYDWVVLSAPAEQSRLLAANTAIANQLPEHISLPCWAVAVATKGDVPLNIQGVFGDDIISWVSRLSARPQRRIAGNYDDLWMLHFSSEWATTHNKTTEVDVVATGFDWLSDILKAHAYQPLKRIYAYQHYWLYAGIGNADTNGHGFGSSSSISSPSISSPPISPITADHVTGIAAIGDWTAGGRVEGAYLSAINFVDHCFPLTQS